MNGPVTVEEFLEIEEQARRTARLRAPAREVRRFHAAVRRFASAWCSGPQRRVALLETSHGVYLELELEDRYGWVPVMSLRAAHGKGEFLLKGPYPDRKKQRLSAELRRALDQLYRTWRALPGAEPAGERCVVVHLPKLADSGFDRFLDSALAACGGLAR